MPTNTNIYETGDEASVPVASGVLAGKPVLIGSRPGITMTPEGKGVGNVALRATVWFKGTHLVPVNGAITGFGQPIYITPAGALDVASAGNTLWGYSHAKPDGTYLTKGAGIADALVTIAKV